MLDDVELRQYTTLAAVTTSILLHRNACVSYVYNGFFFLSEQHTCFQYIT